MITRSSIWVSQGQRCHTSLETHSRFSMQYQTHVPWGVVLCRGMLDSSIVLCHVGSMYPSIWQVNSTGFWAHPVMKPFLAAFRCHPFESLDHHQITHYNRDGFHANVYVAHNELGISWPLQYT